MQYGKCHFCGELVMPFDWDESNDWMPDEDHKPTIEQHLRMYCAKVVMHDQLDFCDYIKREHSHVDWTIWGPLVSRGWKK